MTGIKKTARFWAAFKFQRLSAYGPRLYLPLFWVFMHLAQAFTRWPSKTAYCKLGKRRTIEGLME